MNDSMSRFNTIVAMIFADLLDNFPVQKEPDVAAIAEQFGLEASRRSRPRSHSNGPKKMMAFRDLSYGEITPGVDFEDYIENLVAFLRDEGFVQWDSEWVHSIRLSAKGLSILQATPNSLQASIGSGIKSALKDGLAEGRQAMLGQLVSLAMNKLAGF